MQDLQENKLLFRSIQICYVVLTICALEIFPPLGDLLQMSDLPSVDKMEPQFFDQLPYILQVVDFNIFLFMLMLIDTFLVFFVERQLRRFYDGRENN